MSTAGLLQTTPPGFEIPQGHQQRIATVALSGNATSTEMSLYAAAAACRIRAITFTGDAVLTGNGASGAGATFKVGLRRAGSLVGSMGAVVSQQFNTGTNAAAWVPFSFTLLVKKLRAGDVLTWQWVQGATGLAIPAGIFVVDTAPAGSTRN